MAERRSKSAKSEARESATSEAHETTGGPHAFWSGTLTFGLVSVPVELYAAVLPRRVSFRTLGPDGRPLQRRYYCSKEDRPLDSEEIVRGYQLEPDRYVVLSDEELEALEPGKSREIDLRRFVPREEIDPMLLERPYILAPSGESSKAYNLLASILEKKGRVGIATFVMHGKDYLAAIFAEGGLLRAVTLRYADEVRTPEDIGLPEVSDAPAKRQKEMEAAVRELEQERLDTDKLKDVDAQQILELAESKRAEKKDVVSIREEPAEELEEGHVIDIMELLKERLGSAPPRRRQAAARRQKARAGQGRTSAQRIARARSKAGKGKPKRAAKRRA